MSAGLTGYYDRISKGLYQPGTEIEIVKESPALTLIDARMAMGSVVGQEANADRHRQGEGLRHRHEHRL